MFQYIMYILGVHMWTYENSAAMLTLARAIWWWKRLGEGFCRRISSCFWRSLLSTREDSGSTIKSCNDADTITRNTHWAGSGALWVGGLFGPGNFGRRQRLASHPIPITERDVKVRIRRGTAFYTSSYQPTK